MTPILSAHQLVFAYAGESPTLNDLSLTISAGRKLAILGPNGAGKSTLFLHLNGLLRPQRGTVLLAGQSADYSRRGLNHWRSRVALVLQDPDDQIFATSVAEDVSFGPLNQGLSPATVGSRVENALKAMGIADLATRSPHLLSGGQKKRVAIAGALAMEPEVLLLDEPTAGLDREGADQLIAVLQLLGQRGMTLVFSTHDIELAQSLADDVALFRDGSVLAQGPADVMLSDPELLARAGLRPSVLVEVWRAAQARGLCPRGCAMPRNVDALLALLDPTGMANDGPNLLPAAQA